MMIRTLPSLRPSICFPHGRQTKPCAPWLHHGRRRGDVIATPRGSPYSSPLTHGRGSADSLAEPAARHVTAQPPTDAENALCSLLATPDLDQQMQRALASVQRRGDSAGVAAAAEGAEDVLAQALRLERGVAAALRAAYGPQHARRGVEMLPALAAVGGGQPGGDDEAPAETEDDEDAGGRREAAHLLLQRTLYRINRLCLFWFDDLEHYANDRSAHLARVRDAIEAAWQGWELDQFGADAVAALRQMAPEEIKSQLKRRYQEDVDPPLSQTGRYITDAMGVEGYRELLAVASLDGLVEASRQSRVCGGVGNDVSCAVFRVLMEEYGAGRLAKKHSTFFAASMHDLGLSSVPEGYLDEAPWQVLAGANHNFLLTERRRHYLRYLGGLTFFEIVGPSVYRTYLHAAERLGLSERASGYWALHIKEDERHGRWMLDDVALPLVDRYPLHAWELLLGYDQERFMAQRASAAVLNRIRAADETGFRAQCKPLVTAT